MSSSCDCPDSFLYSPITAVSAGLQWICFAMGNRVLACNSHGINRAWLLTTLPNGAVITALEQHETEATVTPCVLIAAGDLLYMAPLQAASTAQRIMHAGEAARVLRIRSLYPHTAVLTAQNTACLLPHNLDKFVTSTVQLHWSSVIGLGVTLAADALRLPNMNCHVHESNDENVVIVFSATYAGTIALWPLSLSAECVHVAAHITAHRRGCAVFAVRVMIIPINTCEQQICVATCSDDRTAALHVCSVGDWAKESAWSCCWRGGGVSFSRRRVFDVDIGFLHRDPATIFLAVGCEDGGLHSLALRPCKVRNDNTGKEKDHIVPVFSRIRQHDGRGVYRVAVIAPTAIVSCGFDGTVQYTPIINEEKTLKQLCVVPVERRRHQHVRGVACDADGTLIASTEDELVVLPKGSAKERRINLPCSAVKSLPSCLEIISISNTSPPMAAVGSNTFAGNGIKSGSDDLGSFHEQMALIGTTDGVVYGINYSALESSGAIFFVSLGTAAKSLILRGLHSRDRVYVASVHADGSLLLSSCLCSAVMVNGKNQASGMVDTFTPQRIAFDTAGPRVTMLHFWPLCSGRMIFFVGDKDGYIDLYIVDTLSGVVESHMREKVFASSAVSAIDGGVDDNYTMTRCTSKGTATTHAGFSVIIMSSLGEWRVMDVNVSAKCLELRGSRVDPLRLPWGISSVLTFHGSVAVTQLGTDISIYSRHNSLEEHGSLCDWRLLAQYHDVRAPRLLRATIMDDGPFSIFLCHSPDGARMECHTCNTHTATRVLAGGAILGREYNAVVALNRQPTPSFLCGNENAMLTWFPLHEGAPLTLSGPHASNILAMTVLHCESKKVRMVTAGGNATLAVWEWTVTHDWVVIAVTRTSTQTQSGAESVARLLSVCGVDAKNEIIAAGGSDGILRMFILERSSDKDAAQLQLYCTMELSSRVPRPITAVASLAEGMVLAGDTAGRIAVCRTHDNAVVAGSGVVLSSLAVEGDAVLEGWPNGAVNALAVGLNGSPCAGWNVLVSFDSGDVALLRADAKRVVGLATLRISLTAGRGVSWTGEDTAIAVTEEGVVGIEIHSGECLRVRGHRRVNVRGVSGVAVAGDAVCVVGQGIEVFSCNEVLSVI